MNDIIKIAPSILAADFAKLGEEVSAIEVAGADAVHIDVMDGHFVPNITIGSDVVAALRGHSSLPFDVHLMIEPCDPFLESFANAGADIITIHSEAGPHLHRSLSYIKELGKMAGVSIVPATPAEDLEYVMDIVDLILVMTVNPGFGGQKFIDSQLRKIHKISDMIAKSNRDIILEVDGGINHQTAEQVINAGANMLVAGTAVFSGAGSYADNIAMLRGNKSGYNNQGN